VIRIPKDHLQSKIEFRNWIILGVVSAAGFIFLSLNFTLGILAGGVISIANFYGLTSSLRKAFANVSGRTKSFLMIRYYMRFILTGVVIYFLLTRTEISVFGLLIGLSLVVVNIIGSTLYELSKKNFRMMVKEVN
jgi:MFS superfamily sulfate permease-like transporter